MSNPAKYDESAKRKYRRLFFFSLGLFVLFLLLEFLAVFIEVNGGARFKIQPYMVMLTVVLEFVAVPMMLVTGFIYARASIYLKRLKESGDSGESNELPAPVVSVNRPKTNRHASDSKIAAILYGCAFLLMLFGDFAFWYKWHAYESDYIVLLVLLLMYQSVFVIGIFIFLRQSNRQKYIDDVDGRVPGDNRKPRINLFTTVFVLIILCLIGGFGLIMANSMTRYIYRSRNSSYDKFPDQYIAGATMEVSSSDLVNGEWSFDLEERAPQIEFSEVEGAQYYVIYMVDESLYGTEHWYVDDLHTTSLEAGSDAGTYIGLEYGEDREPHVYSISVFALAGKPDSDWEIDMYNDSEYRPMDLYYDVLNVTRRGDPAEYGNVLAYGYISGTF